MISHYCSPPAVGVKFGEASELSPKEHHTELDPDINYYKSYQMLSQIWAFLVNFVVFNNCKFLRN